MLSLIWGAGARLGLEQHHHWGTAPQLPQQPFVRRVEKYFILFRSQDCVLKTRHLGESPGGFSVSCSPLCASRRSLWANVEHNRFTSLSSPSPFHAQVRATGTPRLLFDYNS